MRRGGNYDQMQKTNMYADQPVDNGMDKAQAAAALQQQLDGLPAEALGILGQGKNKKKKKGRKKPRVAEQQIVVQPAADLDESQRSQLYSATSGHSENRRFFENEIARRSAEDFDKNGGNGDDDGEGDINLDHVANNVDLDDMNQGARNSATGSQRSRRQKVFVADDDADADKRKSMENFTGS